jgi:hypothetical protein
VVGLEKKPNVPGQMPFFALKAAATRVLARKRCLGGGYLSFRIWFYIPYSDIEFWREALHCSAGFFAWGF